MNLTELRKSTGISPSFVAIKLGVSYRHFNRMETTGEFLSGDREGVLATIYGTTAQIIKECIKESKKNE